MARYQSGLLMERYPWDNESQRMVISKPKRKIRFEVVPDPLPPALTAEEARSLAVCAIGGDTMARERLICGSLRSVADIVGDLLYSEQDRLCGLRGEDLYSIGCRELCEAVNKLKSAEYPSAYFRCCVEGAIRDAITANAKRAMPPLSDSVPDWDESPFPEIEAAPPLNDREVEFAIEEYGQTEPCKQYLRLRRHGLTIRESAKRIGRPQSSMGDWERQWTKGIL